jgi:NADH dehydrogenase/NADH:ubiquinone oxidoreductase subunit G
MSKIHLQIDGKDVVAKEGMTILEAARSVDISIPTLCDHEKLAPYGACRVCTVESDVNGRTNLVASCLQPVENDLVVRTRTETVDQARKLILEQMLAHAPDSEQLLELAQVYGADKDRFEKESDFCIL